MIKHFLDRGYPIDLLQDLAIKVRRIDRHQLLHPTSGTRSKSTDWAIVVTTYHPKDDNLKQIIHNNWSLLGKSHAALPVFHIKLMTAYR